MFWQTWRTSAMSCSTSSMPTPRSATAPDRISPKRLVSLASSPEDGSSSSRRSNGPGEHPGQLDHPALTGREQPGLELRQRSDPGQLHRVLDGSAHCGALRGAAHQLAGGIRPGQRGLPAQRDVLTHRERGEQLDPLEGPAEAEPGPAGGPE